MSFSNFITEKKKTASGFNREPEDIKALKTTNPRIKSKKGNVDNFLGKGAHKKAKFSVKKKAKRSNTDKAIGRRKRKGGKTKNARKILSDKHGVTKATQKDQNKEYYFDHLQVAEFMKKYGYDWDQETGIWDNKVERKPLKPKRKRKRKPVPGSDGRKKISDFGKGNVAFIPSSGNDDEEPFTVTRDGEEVTVPEDQLTNFTAIGAGGIEYDITEEDLMEYEARFILGLVHGGRSSMHFEEVEESQEDSDLEEQTEATIITVEPIISTDKVLDKIEEIGYEYFPQIDEWRLDGEFPFLEESEEEDKKSILARTYLAALGHFEVFDFNEEDQPTSISKDSVLELMNTYGFTWDPERSTWAHAEQQTEKPSDQQEV